MNPTPVPDLRRVTEVHRRAGPVVRFDDLGSTPTRHWRFEGLVASGVAHRRDEVVPAIRDAEALARREGRWVVLAVAYESASALDPAMVTQATSPGQPLVQWSAFADRVEDRPLGARGAPATRTSRSGSADQFRRAVETIKLAIARGDVYQVNHTDRMSGSVSEPLDLYASLLASQSCSYGAFVDLGHGAIACASPELFFRWDADTITCRPMKGTRPRHPRPRDDDSRAAQLAGSIKDQAENVMIVDLLRNDLGRLARVGSVRVPELFTIERYETVWQMTSTIRADIDPSTSLVDVFRALFPCGSVTGAPKIAAMRAISELEQSPRGVYCGALGYLSPPGHGPRAVFCVPIRTAVVDADGNVRYGAGAGITWSSDPDEENAEVDAKARVLTNPWPPFELLETLRLDQHGVRHLQLHLDRLNESAGWFGVPVDTEALGAALSGLAPVGAPHRVRLLVDRSGTWRVECVPLEPGRATVRLAVDTEVTRSDDVFSCHKTTARAHYAAALARHPGADDVVLVNEHGNAVETTTANLAYRIGARWFTPPLVDGGLPGVGRATALSSGRVHAERSISATDLRGCDEVAVVSDLRGWRRAVLPGTQHDVRL